jgi:hypothetical protein
MKTFRDFVFALPLMFLCACGALAGDGAPSVPSVSAVDVAKMARDARLASVKACKTYQAAVVAGWVQADARADSSCALVQTVCADDFVSTAPVAGSGGVAGAPAAGAGGR